MKFVILIALAFITEIAGAEENCFYINENGVFTSVKSKSDIPEAFRASSQCAKANTKEKLNTKNNSPQSIEALKRHNAYTLKNHIKLKKVKSTNKSLNSSKHSKLSEKKAQKIRPSKVELSLRAREKSLNTLLGKVKLRWDAAAESYFGGALENLVISAMNASSRILTEKSFPERLRMDDYDWEIVIMNDVPNEIDITTNGEHVCHPGWMGYPADIFIVGERVATGCTEYLMPREKATRYLVETLLHEIGHAVEYKFLGRQYRLHERWHQEGFATWFESLGSKYVTSRENKMELDLFATRAWSENWDPLTFTGTNVDYIRGYTIIRTIADKKSVNGLQELYIFASQHNLPLLESIESHLGWNKKKLFDVVSNNLDNHSDGKKEIYFPQDLNSKSINQNQNNPK